MSFDWSQYLDVARELAEQAKIAPPALQEARYRASISRAYYAVFGIACDHLRNDDGNEELQQYTHQYVREAFKSSDDPICKRIGLALERMRKPRNIADYRLDYDELGNLPDTSQLILKWAQKRSID